MSNLANLLDSLFQTDNTYAQLIANWIKQIHANMDLQIDPTIELYYELLHELLFSVQSVVRDANLVGGSARELQARLDSTFWKNPSEAFMN